MNPLERSFVILSGVFLALVFLLPLDLIVLLTDVLQLTVGWFAAWLIEKLWKPGSLRTLPKWDERSIYYYLFVIRGVDCLQWLPFSICWLAFFWCNMEGMEDYPTLLHSVSNCCADPDGGRYEARFIPIRFLVAVYPKALEIKNKNNGYLPLHLYIRGLIMYPDFNGARRRPEDDYTPATKEILLFLIRESPKALLVKGSEGKYPDEEYPSMFSDFIQQQRREFLEGLLSKYVPYDLPADVVSHIVGYHDGIQVSPTQYTKD